MSSEDDAAKLPLTERLSHKIWRVRQNAYIELTDKIREELDETSPIFETYSGHILEAAVDKNAPAQEKGLGLVEVYIDRAPKSCIEKTFTPGQIYKIVDSACGGRPKTKVLARDIFLLLLEVEVGDAVVAALLKGCKHRLAKIVSESLSILCDAVKQFGVVAVPVKPILSALPALFDHTDKKVREECNELAATFFRWGLAPVLQPKFADLRSAQRKELESLAEQIAAETEKPKATRVLRSQNPEFGGRAKVPTNASSGSSGANVTPELDPFDLMEPKDLSKVVTEKWFAQLSAKKWSDRRDALDLLIKECADPRIKPAPDGFAELAKYLKKTISKDTNVIVVARAAEATGLLGRGLRKEFSKAARVVIPALLDKFKEKKNFCVAAISTSLDMLHPHVLQLAETLDLIMEAGANPVPQVRSNTLLWAARCLESGQHGLTMRTPHLKKFLHALLGTLEDSSPDVRSAAAKVFGLLVGAIGERALGPFLEKLDPVRLKKVKAFIPKEDAAKADPSARSRSSSNLPATSTSATSSSATSSSTSAGSSTAPSASSARDTVGEPTLTRKRSKRSLVGSKSRKSGGGGRDASDSRSAAAAAPAPPPEMAAEQKYAALLSADQALLAVEPDFVLGDAGQLVPEGLLQKAASS
eukprot:CAMPEP_0174234862 /NCGR_PEP_ID=MMETSP0417-20130205/4489_1 /TAXON_ID=242541 /ORGANISM="Mayorella sp, Strain BSH-02190019" /LENGTH=643 /DNA_ID=CAMNT_0015313283 /DNA_START=386 /DNA_END=2314 /DNA_ORIENTATION=+